MNYGKNKMKRMWKQNKEKMHETFVRNARRSIFVLDYDSNNYYAELELS